MTTTTKTNTAIEITTTDKMTTAANQVTLGAMISLSGLVGVWGVACMVSAIAQSGGIATMASTYLTAIGM